MVHLQKTWQWPRCDILLKVCHSLDQKRKKTKLKLKQELLPTRKNVNIPSSLYGKKTDRGLFLCRSLPVHIPNNYIRGKKFVKSAKQHLQQTKQLPRTMCLCKAALLSMSNQSRFKSRQQIMRGQLLLFCTLVWITQIGTMQTGRPSGLLPWLTTQKKMNMDPWYSSHFIHTSQF